MLLPNGLEALQQMGLGDIFRGVPQVAPTAVELYANAQSVFRLDVDPDFVGPHRPTAFSQPAFLEAVVGAADAYSGFRVELGARVHDLVHEGARVVGVQLQNEGHKRNLLADLVVGADGRISVIRRRCGLEVSDQGLEVDIVWCKVPLPDSLGADVPVRVYVSRAHLLIAYRVPDDLLQVAWVITKGTYGELRRRGIEE